MMKKISVSFVALASVLSVAATAYAQSAEDFAVEPSIRSAALSPDGEILALGVANEGSQQINLVTLDGISAVSSKSLDIDFPRNSREDILWLGWAGDNRLLNYVTFIDAG